MIRRVGYARVLPGETNIDQQVTSLKHEGCVLVFTDETTGCRKRREGFEDCLKSLNSGDVLVIHSLDRVGCSLTNLVAIICSLAERKIGIETLEEDGFKMNPSSSAHLTKAFRHLARYQTNLSYERTLSARKSARASGKLGGRPAKVPRPETLHEIQRLSQERSTSVTDICKKLKISRSNYYRYLSLSKGANT